LLALAYLAGMKAIALDLDALGDTRPLWRDFLADSARRFAAISPLDPDALPLDRAAAAEELDRWAEQGVGDWRHALERFAEDRAPVYLRPSAEASAALRALTAAGVRIGVYTDAPEPLARIALAHLGAERRVDVLETGAGAKERLRARLGGAEVVVAATLADLTKINADG
jgi:phosphoglycolate phosphatase-like HAD superfamily hydrolase